MSHFIVEIGSGISVANSFASVSYVLEYLTDRNRQEENGWSDLDLSAQESNIIAATDYLDKRFRTCFKGSKEFRSLKNATGGIRFLSNPLDTTTITLGSQTYTFRASLAGANDVLIGASTSASIDNLVSAIVADPAGLGVVYGNTTVANPEATAEVFENDSMVATALVEGTAGNSIISTTTVAGSEWQDDTLIGGNDVGAPQPLSFPRVNLFDRDGIRIVGMPDRLKQATSEYAVRAAASILQPDPDVTTGRAVVELEETVDVITEKTKWQEGGAIRISVPYPAADSLLEEYLRVSGIVMRA